MDNLLQKALSFFFVLLCLVFFLLHVWDQVDKHLQGQTTILFEAKKHESLEVPGIAICTEPQLNYDAMKENGIPEHQWSAHEKDSFNESLWQAPRSKNEADSWYNLSTFSAEEILSKSYFVDSNKLKERLPLHAVATLRSVPTINTGMCQRIQIHRPISSIAQYIWLHFNFPQNSSSIR